jgi:hypothetical protein
VFAAGSGGEVVAVPLGRRVRRSELRVERQVQLEAERAGDAVEEAVDGGDRQPMQAAPPPESDPAMVSAIFIRRTPA